MASFDVVIVGGGPIGSTVARLLAQNGASTCVIERKEEIGFPSHCSGLVSRDFIDLGAVPEHLILNRIMGGTVYSFDTASYTFKNDIAYAYVIDRTGYDQFAYRMALSKGAKYILNSRIKSFERRKDCLRIFIDNNEDFIDTRIVVIATGGSFSVKKLFAFNEKPTEDIKTIQVETDFKTDNPHLVYIYMNNNIAHNWFSWVIPINGDRARIGLGTDRNENLLELFHRLCNEWDLLKGATIYASKRVIWHIPIGLARESIKDNVILVGDAAFQVKPFSGGGLYTGTLSAFLASEVILKALEKNDFSRNTLKEYERLWRPVIGREIERERTLRDIYTTITDIDKSEIIKELNRINVTKILTTYGRIDEPWRAGFPLILRTGKIVARYIGRKFQKLFKR